MKNIIKHIFLVLFVLTIIPLVFAVTWYPGDLHRHTGFSTFGGYDGVSDSDCDLFLEDYVPRWGYTTSDLKNDALSNDLSFLSFTDHSYCMDSSEFNTVKTDCQNAEDVGTFTCLVGEEVSTKEIVADFEISCTIYDIYGETHIGAHGIDTYISQSPEEEHCPDDPTVTEAITNINTERIS